MPREVSEFRVVIASPNDLLGTRKVLFDVIDELNRSFDIQKVHIRGLGWEEYVTPGIGMDAQDVVNQQLLTDYDILIALFSTKLGSPTERATSGTIEEIEHAIANTTSPMGKYRVQVYFRDRIDSASSLSMDEFKKVMDYREALKPRGVLFGLFKSDDDLQREIRVNVQRPILDFLRQRGADAFHPVALPTASENSLPATSTPNVIEIASASDGEEFGILDYQEKADTAIAAFNISMGQMADLLKDITVEMNLNVERISESSFVSSTAADKKVVINSFSSFLKSKSTQLEYEARVASDSIEIFAANLILMAEIERQGKSDAYEKNLEVFLKVSEVMLAALVESRSHALSFRNTMASMPRITIQFNQAKKMLVQAVDECLALFDRAEKNIYEITVGL